MNPVLKKLDTVGQRERNIFGGQGKGENERVIQNVLKKSEYSKSMKSVKGGDISD